MTGINPTLFLRALSFSADKHRHAKRKDVDETPYILHPIAVATVLAVEGNITDETLLIAALLHDTVEDTDVTREQVTSLFGEVVASIVMEVTNGKDWSKEEKKKRQAERMKTASNRAKQLKIADKTCNIRDIMQIPPVGWSAEKRLDYLASSKLVVDNCRGINPALEAVFDAMLHEGVKKLTEESRSS